ncbi:hypothetical protein [Metamycoplasma hyosynoviae]|uniref:Uncharacterized protein n=1 Tax=Metamycoplasma hyosynoviae TaxID=29559 RepID=A0A4R7TYP2_9BACT|nr:hypothetical protein [Metamycoplasma hyosynoviae]TDU98025.1 hypothetical protein JN03_0034 [Metamycoplasma hyosynoviae]
MKNSTFTIFIVLAILATVLYIATVLTSNNIIKKLKNNPHFLMIKENYDLQSSLQEKFRINDSYFEVLKIKFKKVFFIHLLKYIILCICTLLVTILFSIIIHYENSKPSSYIQYLSLPIIFLIYLIFDGALFHIRIIKNYYLLNKWNKENQSLLELVAEPQEELKINFAQIIEEFEEDYKAAKLSPNYEDKRKIATYIQELCSYLKYSLNQEDIPSNLVLLITSLFIFNLSLNKPTAISYYLWSLKNLHKF